MYFNLSLEAYKQKESEQHVTITAMSQWNILKGTGLVLGN